MEIKTLDIRTFQWTTMQAVDSNVRLVIQDGITLDIYEDRSTSGFIIRTQGVMNIHPEAGNQIRITIDKGE